ncbi:MAG: aminopeptidase P N-terminal domain-containing protein, partial [Micrococcales bacterium]|nr:aminopeptidase P N-terminal domain-containing protein [Micrococcales bacterium]
MVAKQAESVNRINTYSEAFKQFICADWAPYPVAPPAALPATGPAAKRRAALSAAFPGVRLVLPAGGLKPRNNDCDYRFRPDSAFAYFTGLGTDREPDAVLVMEPASGGHKATLYFHPRVPRTDPEFYASSRYGEMWVGQRMSLDEMSALAALPSAQIETLPDALTSGMPTAVLRDADPDVAAMVDTARGAADGRARQAGDVDRDGALKIAASEARLFKDDFELSELRKACDLTAQAFEAVVRELGAAQTKQKGERWIE